MPHRLGMEDILENKNRIEIIEIILKEPGIHFNDLLDHLNMASGTLVWHLDVLETYKVIKKENVGKYVVYYPYTWENPFSKIEIMFYKNKTTLELFKMINDNPGI
jgi:predicted transcriptional regulator